MHSISTPAIVIHTLAIREADTMVVLLTRQLGRVSAFARSARKSRKRFMGGLDVFDCGVFELNESRGSSGAYTVEQLTNREHWPALRENLPKFAAACYCLELTTQFAPEHDQDSAALFLPLYHCLRSINSSTSAAEEKSLAVFYNLVLLKLSGFNFLDDGARMLADPALADWFTQMIEGSQPIVPYDEQLLRQGLHRLVTFTQEIIGKELKSAAALC